MSIPKQSKPIDRQSTPVAAAPGGARPSDCGQCALLSDSYLRQACLQTC